MYVVETCEGVATDVFTTMFSLLSVYKSSYLQYMDTTTIFCTVCTWWCVCRKHTCILITIAILSRLETQVLNYELESL